MGIFYNQWTWEDCHKIASKYFGSKKQTKKLENNTYLTWNFSHDGSVVYGIVLHNTTVVKLWKDGTIQLHSGGWETRTTKDRMNRYCRLGVWSKRGKWMVSAPDIAFPIHWRELGILDNPNASVEFEDGIKWHPRKGFF